MPQFSKFSPPFLQERVNEYLLSVYILPLLAMPQFQWPMLGINLLADVPLTPKSENGHLTRFGTIGTEFFRPHRGQFVCPITFRRIVPDKGRNISD